MDHLRNISAAFFLIFISVFSLNAQDKGYVHEISAGARSSYILQTNGFYTGFNPLGTRLEQSSSAHVEYTFRLPETSRLGSLYGSYQGIGVGIQSFGSHEHIGTPLSLYAVQGASLTSLGSWASLDYRWNLGLSYGWVNEDSKLTASKTNAYLGIGLFMSIYAGKHFKLSLGPEYAHYSNGDTKFPNCGTNILGIRASLSGRFGNDDKVPHQERLFMKEDQKKKFADRMSYDLILHGAWRADRTVSDLQVYVVNRKFPVCGFMFNPLYHFNRYISAGPALDFIYDRSTNLITHVEDREFKGFEYPSLWKQMAPGLSIRTELRMSFISINAGYGYSFSPEGSELDVRYAVFGLKAFLSEKFYFNLGYRLNNKVYTHSLMFGLGWRWGKAQ